MSEAFADHFQSICSSMNYDQEFQILKFQEERVNLNFDTNEKLMYQYMFKIGKLEHALETCGESAAGHDSIMYGMLNHLPLEGKKISSNFITRSGYLTCTQETEQRQSLSQFQKKV
ncbi:hypothetical protein JTB14_025783 [Gonioctena quinquepunctata]|nr:hypothetical protein JTB14_025783 [Gonioctena quinquepunctata]